MSRRQTLGPLSPGALNAARGVNNAAAVTAASRVLTAKGNDMQQQSQAALGGSSVPAKAPRKSMAPSAMAAAAAAAAGAAAAAADPRRSSAFGGKPSGPKQDPRPLHDKNFLNDCIRTVITYLSTHAYPGAPVSPKTLASPTSKDFTTIAQFLFQQFDPSLKAFGKMEDEVPLFFKRLNYPFQISKSALFAVGSPHSWPAVLAALTWLVELLNYNEKAEEGATTGSGTLDTEEGGNKKEFFEFIATSYKYFLAGDDMKCEAVEEEILASYRRREEAIQAQHAKTKESNDAVAAELERLRTEPSPLVAVQQKLAEHRVDASKFEALIENLQTMKATTSRKLAERQADVKSKQEQIAGVTAANEALRARVASQPVNKADLNRMILERTKQREVLDAVTCQCEEMERKVHQQEVQTVSELRTLEASQSRYNQLAHRLKLVPVSAKRADGTAFELRINRDASAPSEFSNLDLKGIVRPALDRLCDQYRTKAVELGHDLLSLKEQAASGRESIAERGEENALLEQQIQHMEHQLKGAREAQEHRVREEAGRADVLKSEVARLRVEASARQADMETRKRATVADLEAVQRNCESELQRVKFEVKCALELLVQHRLWVKQRLEGVAATVQAAHGEVQQLAR